MIQLPTWVRVILALPECDFNTKKVSRNFFMSQPSTSILLQKLEKQLGTPILTKENRKFTGFTPVGKQLYKLATSLNSKTDEFNSLYKFLK